MEYPSLLPEMRSIVPTVPNPVASLGISQPQKRKKQKKRQAVEPEPLSDEEASSLASMAMGMASGVGNFLDVPGSMVRDVLAGEDPWDQLSTPLSSDNRAYGEDLLQQWGMAGKEDTWGRMLGGLGVDIATDPLTWFTGPLSTAAKLGKGGKIGSKMGKSSLVKSFTKSEDLGKAMQHLDESTKAGSRALDYLPNAPAAWSDQVRAGERGVAGFGVPFTDIQLATFGAGSKLIPDLVDKAFYGSGPISKWISATPRGVRSLLSHSAGGTLNADAQKALDLRYAEHLQLSAALENVMPSLAARRNSLYDDYVKIAEKHGMEGDRVAFGDMMREATELKDRVPGVEDMMAGLERALGGKHIPTLEAADIARQSSEYVNALRKTEDIIHERVKRLGGSQKDLDDLFARYFSRRGDYKDLMKYGVAREDVLKDIPGGTVTLNRISRDANITSLFDKVPDNLVGKERDEWLRQYGGKRKAAERKMRQWLRSKGMKTKGASQSEIADAYLFQKYIDPELLRATNNGKGHILERVPKLDKNGKQLLNSSGLPATEMVKTKNSDLYKRYYDDWWTRPEKGKPTKLSTLRQNFNRRSEHVLEEGIFNHTELGDWQDYMQSLMYQESTLRTVQNMLAEEGLVKVGTHEGHVSLAKAWDAAKLGDGTKQGLTTLAERLKIDPSKIDDLVIPEPMAKSLAAYKSVLEVKTQKKVSELVKLWDKGASLYRGMLTTPFPAFHARNALSGVFQEMTAGKLTPAQILDGKRAAIKHIQKGGEQLQYYDEIVASGILGGHGRIADVIGEMGAHDMGFDPEKLGGITASLGGMFDKSKWNPLDMRGVRYHADDIAKAAKKGKPIDPKLNWYAESGERMYTTTEFVLRAGYYNALRKANYTAAQAKHFTNQAHFDYSKLSQFEKKVMRRGMLFYTWRRKSVPYVMLSLAERPGGAKAQAIRALNTATRGEDEGYMPQYLRDKSSIPWSTDEEGRPTFLSQGGMPIEDLNIMSLRNTWKGSAQRSMKQLLAQTNPVLSKGYEFMTGEDPYTGRPAKELASRSERLTSLIDLGGEGKGKRMPLADFAINASPLSRAYSEGEKVANLLGVRESGRNFGENLMNLTTGARFTTPDPERYKLIDAIQGIRDKLEADTRVRESTRPYVPARYKDEISPEILQMLMRMHELEKLSRARKDR